MTYARPQLWTVIPDFTPGIGRDVVGEQATEVCLTALYSCAVCGAENQTHDMQKAARLGLNTHF